MNKKKRIRGLERDFDDLSDCVAGWHLQLLSDIAALSRRVEKLEQRPINAVSSYTIATDNPLIAWAHDPDEE